MLAQAKTQSKVKLGEGIITGGLVLQVIFFGLFLIVASIFHYRIAILPTTRAISSPVPWKKHLLVLYLSSTLILIRSLFRIAEYVSGNDGPLLKTEIYLYVFDAALMFLVMLVFAIWHPSQIISGKNRENDYADVEMIPERYRFEQPK
jgi:hypothetical protein